MNAIFTDRHPGWKILITVGIWSGVSLLISVFTLISVLSGVFYLPPLKILSFEFVCILPWMISTPLLVWVAKKYRLDQPWTLASLIIHLLVASGIFSFHSMGQSATVAWFFEEPLMWSYIQYDFLRFLDMRVILYGGFMLGFYTVDYHKKNQIHSMREPRLTTEINRLRYKILKNQLQPRFQMRTIDAVIQHMRTNPQQAEQILSRLSEMLRMMLQNSEKDEVTIREDVYFMEGYFRILEQRLGRELEFESQVEKVCQEGKIPPATTIIPFIEEIIKRANSQIQKLRKVVYEAHRIRSEYVQLRLIFAGLMLSEQELKICYKNAGIDQIVESVKQHYHQQYPFSIFSADSGIVLELTLPLVVNESFSEWEARQLGTSEKTMDNEMD